MNIEVKWLGATGFIPSVGLVETDKLAMMDYDLAQKFIKEGRAEEVQASNVKVKKTKEE